MARGFYSVVQYCPDRFRAEAVNVGLVLLCLEPHAVRVRMTRNHDRLRKLFAVPPPELKNLKLAAQGLTSRIDNSAGELRTVEDLRDFAASRANDFRLTEPRLAKLENIKDDFERLFSELVEARATNTPAVAEALPRRLTDSLPRSLTESLPRKLAEAFDRLQQAKKMWTPGEIVVPVYKTKLDVPYAYRNGVVNLVKPHIFPASKRAETDAATLAVNGTLIREHRIDGEQKQLIVVSTQETPRQAREVTEHVEPLFKEYGLRLIRPNDVDAFASEVEKSAH